MKIIKDELNQNILSNSNHFMPHSVDRNNIINISTKDTLSLVLDIGFLIKFERFIIIYANFV